MNPPLIDVLSHKHEFRHYDPDRTESWQRLDVQKGDRTYRVYVPFVYDNGVERIVRVDDSGDLLFLLGQIGHDHRGERLGCLIVARPMEDGSHRTLVFHTLYPGAVKGIPHSGGIGEHCHSTSES